MRNIVDCVNAFLPLLNTEYELVLGRKYLMKNRKEDRNLYLFMDFVV